jgi:hypothetical protein
LCCLSQTYLFNKPALGQWQTLELIMIRKQLRLQKVLKYRGQFKKITTISYEFS